jgi:chemotaxis protein MotB
VSSRKHGGGGHGSEERWLITYADMITLLMAFFIMLYAMSVVNLDKFNQLAISVRSGFGGDQPELMYDKLGVFSAEQGSQGSAGGRGLSDVLGMMKQVAGTVGKALSKGAREHVHYYAGDGNVTIRLNSDDVLFPRGSADLTAEAKRTLRAVARALQETGAHARVEGHTCDLPIHGRFASNWELSAQRAINVLLYLQQVGGIAPERLSAAGYADTHPVAPNDTEAHRALNRRIDIVVQATGSSARTKGTSEQSGQGAKPGAVNVLGPPPDAPVDITQDQEGS